MAIMLILICDIPAKTKRRKLTYNNVSHILWQSEQWNPLLQETMYLMLLYDFLLDQGLISQH